MDPDAIWDVNWDQSRDGCINDGCIRWGGDRQRGRGSFVGEFGCSMVTNGDFVA